MCLRYSLCIVLFHNNNRNIFSSTINPFPIHFRLIDDNIISLRCLLFNILKNTINYTLIYLFFPSRTLYFDLMLLIFQLFLSKIKSLQVIFIFYRLAILLYFFNCRLHIYLDLFCTIFIDVSLKSLSLNSSLKSRSAVEGIIYLECLLLSLYRFNILTNRVLFLFSFT